MEILEHYIDFEKMWEDIRGDWLEILDDIDDIDNLSEKQRSGLKDFLKNNDVPIITDDCTLNGSEICFSFGVEFDDANESDPCNSFLVIELGYNLDREMFTFYEEKSG